MTPQLSNSRHPDSSSADLPTTDLRVGVSDDVCANVVAPLTPAAGARRPDQFDGFEILSELGRGAAGRVYLARQFAPVRRTVVLKVGQYLSAECEKLAKLQHPNVVPVYSFHQNGHAQAVCMPYRGPLTLGHLVARLQSENIRTLDGRALTTVIEECRKGRQPAADTESAEAGRPEDLPRELAAPNRSAALFGTLRGLNYTDATLTLIRQVVAGLRAAHGERIVHCDLKPANVLIGDDGSAQLLDFGIAFDKAELASRQLRLGGTRPYMSPEQLRSLAEVAVEHDERSDLYSVGVMLYELLAGRYPYPADFDPDAAALERDRERRFVAPTPLRALNARVPYAVESIVRKCLAPDPTNRYQSAADLLDDLDRQIARRPLRFAPNVSQRERLRNWATRNRAVLAVVLVLGVAGTATGAIAARDARTRAENRRLEVAALVDGFAADRENAEFCFFPADRDPEFRARAWAAAESALSRLRAWESDDWFQAGELASLPPDRLDGLRRDSARLMLQLAHSRGHQAAHTGNAAERDGLLREAAQWNSRAERVHPNPASCRVVWSQREFLARLGGDVTEADRLKRRANGLPSAPAEAVLEGRQLYAEGRLHAALAAFVGATRADPQHFWGHYYAAICHQLLGDARSALAEFDICAAIRPGYFGTHFNRGQVRLRLNRTDAEDDLDKALELRPDWADGHFERALIREVQQRFPDAVADLDRALALGYTPTSVYLVRSRVRGRMGEKEAADKDFAAAIKTPPSDERGWLARAQAQLYRNPDAALADYATALKLNPRLTHALQGTAHLLARAGKNKEAADALTKVIDLDPDSADAWSGRGVVRARLGDRELALADARAALRLSGHPATKYQVAGIHALFAGANADDRTEALSLLDAALRAGFGFDLLGKDRELDGLRKDADFVRMVAAAKAYWTAHKPTN